ncbi:hypothetical protein DFH11DRAFT_460376 [Phellopilus nigrolimitatus]|nr:hypothetical protein DFH11DRAFT_460376 [Phellopilus nigrolimitatus]
MGATTQESPTQDAAVRVLVRGSPEPFYQECEEDIEAVLGPDLALNFEGDNDDDVESHSEPSSEILCWDNNQDQDTPVSGEEAPYGCVTPLIPTQIASQSQIDTSDVERVHAEIEEIWDDDEEMNRAQKTTHAKVAQGWATRFSFGSPAVMGVTGRNAGMQMPLSTPKASQFGRAKITKSASAPRPRPDSSGCQAPRNGSGLKPRKSDPYPLIRPIASTATSFESHDTPIAMLSDDIEEVVCSTKSRLESFRCVELSVDAERIFD